MQVRINELGPPGLRAPRAGWAVAATLLLASCGGPGLDQLAGGPKDVVVEVRSGDVVLLKGGQVVRLAGVESPRRGEPFAEEARAALAKLTLGQPVQLMFGGARQDAYGRTLAHLRLVKDGTWVERALLAAGDARVHTYADNQPEQSYSERQLYESALDRMAREVAAIERIDRDAAIGILTKSLQKAA